MGKRKHKDRDEDIHHKIRRLERKLRENRRDRDRQSDRFYKRRSQDRYQRPETPYSSEDQHDSHSDEGGRSERDISDDREYYSDQTEQSGHEIIDEQRPPTKKRMRSVVADTSASSAKTHTPACTSLHSQASSSRQDTSLAAEQPASTPPTTAADIEVPAANISPDVPQEILDILGEAKKVDQALGEKVPSEISKRWGEILVDGLAKEQKEALAEKMLIPENFLLARAPKLNPEVVAVLSESVKNRDKRLEKAQGQLGTGLAGLVNLTKDLIKEDMDKLEIIKRISEVSQILLDLHYEETVNRRKLIVPLLDKKFWNTIHGVKRDEFLFGDKLGENIKNTKDIEKSSQHIKKPALSQPPFQRKAVPGNSRVPPRQQSGAKSTATAANRYQPSTGTRRNTTQRGGRQASSSKHHDKRRR
ncbi:hypothetical protein O0L34_g10059 [Tuta absoluta]|nr:hypothetical protein O0L34_g10059 [Tuta absoluta]